MHVYINREYYTPYNVFMQQKNEKTEKLARIIGYILSEKRKNVAQKSLNQIAHEFDLDVGNISRIEKGLIDVKVVTLWKISEALGIKLSEIIKDIEKTCGKDFHFFDD